MRCARGLCSPCLRWRKFQRRWRHCTHGGGPHCRGRTDGVRAAPDCELVDYANATVLPGLIDTHVHLVGNSGVMALERAAGYSSEEIDEVGQRGAPTPARRRSDDRP
jgi:cytosine/adenosine deaminase-related metal-dependent hydrolase